MTGGTETAKSSKGKKAANPSLEPRADGRVKEDLLLADAGEEDDRVSRWQV